MIPNRTMSFIWHFIKKYKFYYLSWLLTLTFVDLVSIFGGSYMYKTIGDSVNNGILTKENLIYYSMMFAFTMTIWSITMALTRWIIIRSITKAKIDIKNEMFSYCIDHELEYFNNRLSGDLNNRINTLVNKTEDILNRFNDIFSNLFAFQILLIILYKINIYLFIFTLSWLIIYHCILLFLINLSEKRYEKTANNKNKSAGIITDCFINISNIKIFSSERKEYRTIRKQSSNIIRSNWDIVKIEYLVQFTNYLFTSLLTSGSLIISFILLLNDKISLGMFLFMCSFLSSICYWVQYEIVSINKIIEYSGSIMTALKILLLPAKIKDKENAKNIEDVKGKIVFKHINFSYNEVIDLSQINYLGDQNEK